MPMNFGWRRCANVVALGLAMALSACGGGGGGGDTKGATPSAKDDDGMVTLSGTLAVVETAAVDWDTNDSSQVSPHTNDYFSEAQPLTTPFNLVGTVNVAGAGPNGRNKDKVTTDDHGQRKVTGDNVDGYVVDLKADQVVELTFSADPKLNDLALVIFDANEKAVASSVTTGSTECVRISQDGRYYIAVYATVGASIYNLRVGAPGTSRACPTATLPQASTVAGQLIAKPRTTAAPAGSQDRLGAQSITASPAATAARLQSEAGVTQLDVPPGTPTLLTLPATARDRLKGLAQLTGHSDFKRASAFSQAASLATLPEDNMSRMRDTLAYAQALMATGQYEYVELNHTVMPSQAQALVGTFPPNDTYYPYQRWHYEQINLPAAMERLANLPAQPDRRPLVAVIDSGIVADHPDLRSQIEGGRTFVSVSLQGDHDSADPNDPDQPSGTGDPAFHGSHVAGTIAASTFDAHGAAGIAPMAKILPLRVFDPAKSGASDFDIAHAMLYAAGLPNRSNRLPSRKADVINLSLGGPNPCLASYADIIRQVRQAGVIVVAATGNSAKNNSNTPVPVASPANCPGVVAVGALDAQRRQADYSQSGPELRVSAPGGDMSRSTTGNPAGDMVFSTTAGFTPQGSRTPSYAFMDGTSMASPHVAGVVALMKYVYPGLTPDKFDAWLNAGKLTDDVGGRDYDTATGHGLINARKAVDMALAEAQTPGPIPPGKIVATPFALDFGAQTTSMSLGLGTTAATTAVVTKITSSSAALSFAASSSVDTKTGLGTYTISVNRTPLPLGTSFLSLTIQTTQGSFTVQVTVVKPSESGGGQLSGDYGPVYVLAVDANTEEILAHQTVLAERGHYSWNLKVKRGSKIYLLAGGDLDQNQFICDAGEPCGGYPLLSDALTTITPNGNMSGLNFALSPMGTGGNSLTSLSQAAGSAPGLTGQGHPRP